ncbi:hypothetical protein ACRJX6_003716 [Klebsiella pneumoniae]|uniref:hypothetical protein n=1 Tax=Klebsiella pneumoniae TaxID=573 RepID=UPI0035B6C5B6|nr:hypothetical protein [Klebsiella pneumoniae]
MKELTINEMESIAGAYSWDFSSFSSALTSILSNSAEAVASALLLGSAAAALEILLVERMVVITAACLVWVRWVWQLVGFMVLLLEPLPVQFLV